jgi:hypothetical protein
VAVGLLMPKLVLKSDTNSLFLPVLSRSVFVVYDCDM